ncbi:MAG TPA: C25 family cysteine peptidase, partial [Rhodanobacteraceae bacterium]|nr:C25 family cysteine peptidase [Rhodanobacteraceae bacterium]
MSASRCIRLAGFALAALPLSAFACEGRLHIELQETGVYSLDYDAIVAQQPGLKDCATDSLRLTGQGKEVPIRIVGERFGPGARIEWIGRRLHGPESWFDPYSVDNVYLLGAGPGPHARLAEADAPGTTASAPLERRLHLEQENLMIRLDQQQQRTGEESDVWQWAKLTHIDPAPFETSFDLPDLAARADVALTLDFRGLSELSPPADYKGKAAGDHSVSVRINGKPVATIEWNGRDEIRRELHVPSAVLKARANTLSLAVPKRKLPWDGKSDAIDVVMFNWIEARYAIAGDLDVGALPFTLVASGTPVLSWRGEGAPVLYGSDGKRRAGRALGAHRYAFAPAEAGVELLPALENALAQPKRLRPAAKLDWTHPAQGYDYLIVAHPKLIDAIRPLAAFHEKRGLKVAILDVNDVYDEFNDGITHPRAIRNLVDRAWHEWPSPQPRFLLLVGDASFDIRHETYNDLNYAKWTHLELLYPNHFGSVPGERYEKAPQKLADRNLIPTWQYPSPEGQSASDNWFGAVGIDWHPVVAVGRFPVVEPAEVGAIVDKTIDYLSRPDLGAWRRDVMFITDEVESFKHASDKIASALGEDGFVADKVYANPAVSENAAHQNAIRQGIDDGRLIVHFIGHGGRFIWRTGPPDLRRNQDLFTLKDVDSLTNAKRLPMVLSMTCYSAPFDNPTEDSIGEKFLREPGKGAIAVFAASWRNAPSSAFSKSVIDELLRPGATIGEAIVRAKKDERDRTLVEMYNLLGDPAVVLERPRDTARLAYDGDRWNPAVDIDLGAHFRGQLVADWSDAKGARLASKTYHVDQARVRLPVPSLANAEPSSLRIYAASPGTGRDLVGGIEIEPPRPEIPWTARLVGWWRGLTQPPYVPPVRQADTIALS